MRWLSGALLIFSVMLLGGCGSFFCKLDEKDVASYLNKRVEKPMIETRTVPVYFVTNRKTDATVLRSCRNSYFTTNYDSNVAAGLCEVNVPYNHPVGALDASQRYNDRDNYFILGNYTPSNKEELLEKLSESDRELLLFVHGFNVKFEEAVFRSAQLLYDLKFQGDAVLYSWPAGEASSGFFDSIMLNKTYEKNLESARKSREQFRVFLEDLSRLNRKINVVVHSMGHQVTLPVIAEISREKGQFLNQLIMNAPDFPEDGFLSISQDLSASAQRATMYCSPSDNALNVSEIVNWKARAGSCVNAPGIDVINVQQVDEPVMGVGGLGHGYYSSRAILTDLYQAILGVHVEKRLFIGKSIDPDREDYIMRR